MHCIHKECFIYSKQKEKNENFKSSLNLKLIQEQSENRELIRIRNSISLGVHISLDKEKKQIKLANKSKLPIYWLKASACQKFVSNQINPNEVELISIENSSFEENVINISFGKYCGSNSKRRKSIEYCPCWISISINDNYFKSN